jgi:hypothetical protein
LYGIDFVEDFCGMLLSDPPSEYVPSSAITNISLSGIGFDKSFDNNKINIKFQF